MLLHGTDVVIVRGAALPSVYLRNTPLIDTQVSRDIVLEMP